MNVMPTPDGIQSFKGVETPDGPQQFHKKRPKRQGLARKMGKNNKKERFGSNMGSVEDFEIMNITNQMLASERKAAKKKPLLGVWGKRANQKSPNQYMNVVPNKPKRKSSRKSSKYMNVAPNPNQYMNVDPNKPKRKSSRKSSQYLNVAPNPNQYLNVAPNLKPKNRRSRKGRKRTGRRTRGQ